MVGAGRSCRCAGALFAIAAAWIALAVPAAAESVAPLEEVEFDGRVVEIEDRSVTFRLMRVHRNDTGEGIDLRDPAGRVVVVYDSPPSPLQVGAEYRVRAWNIDGALESRIAEPGSGTYGEQGTTALDGSFLIGESLDRRLMSTIGMLLPAMAAVAGAAAVGRWVWVRQRHPT